MNTIFQIIKKEFIQFMRDPKMFGIIFFAPIFQLIFFGYAVNMDVENVRTIVFDMDNSQRSRNYLEKFESSGYFEFIEYVDNYNDLQINIESGKAVLGIIIPRSFEEKIERRESVKLQAIFDGSDGNRAGIAAGYAAGITLRYSKEILLEFADSRGLKNISAGSIAPEIRAWYNPELRTRNFMVPGIVGMLLSIITLLLTSLAIVKEKEIGTLEQIIVTPIKPLELMIGKIVPFAAMGFIVVVLVLIVMTFVFDIAVKGSYFFLFVSSFIYILSTLGLGIFVSTISRTQQQAMMLAIFTVLMPMIFLSGFAFPIENMPEFMQWLTYFVPLSYFMNIIRGIILKGIGFYELWPDLAILFIMGTVVMYLSSLRFKQRLE